MTRSLRRVALLAGLLAVLAIVVGLVLHRAGDDETATATAEPSVAQPSTAGVPDAAAEPGEGVTVPAVSDPPPPDEVAVDPAPDRAGGASVDPVVTYAAWDAGTSSVEVNGYVAGVVELEGTCRLTLVRGSETFVDENAADPDASTMSCGLLTVDSAGLSAGTWTAVLSYESATSAGRSADVEVEVPAR